MTREELKSIRKLLGLTQAKMAEQLGLTLRGYQEIESGRSPVRAGHALLAKSICPDGHVMVPIEEGLYNEVARVSALVGVSPKKIIASYIKYALSER